MEKPSFDLIRQILRSPLFLSQSLDEQQATLDQIISTGEITREEVFKLISEGANKEQEIPNEEIETISMNLENFDHQSFINFILRGNIKGKDLIALCNTSRKLNDYCNRSFQPLDRYGVPYGEEQTEYLFRMLLDMNGTEVPVGKSPKQIYIDIVTKTDILQNFSHYGYSMTRDGKKSFGLAERRVEDKKDKRHFARECYAYTMVKLLDYLWSVKVNIYVRVIIPNGGGNIWLFKLKSSNINDVEIGANGLPEMVVLYPDKSFPKESDRIFDGVIHYTHIYPEILQWFFPKRASKIDLNDFRYPNIGNKQEQYVIPEIIYQKNQLSSIDTIKLLPDEVQRMLYESKDSFLNLSLSSLINIFLSGDLRRDGTNGNIYLEDYINPLSDIPDQYNPGHFLNYGVRFKQSWPDNKTFLCILIYLLFYLQHSIIEQ